MESVDKGTALVITMSDKPGFLLVRDGEVVEEFVGSKNDSSGWFVRLEQVLRKNEISISRVNELVLDAGPGSFTGLRISFAVVKVWGFLFPSIRVYPISNLAIWKEEGRIVVKPAGRGNVYVMRSEKGESKFSLVSERVLEDCEEPVVWAGEVRPNLLWDYFQRVREKISPVEVGELYPLYIYPDDCSVHQT